MAAAASVEPVSPELALVDAALASDLRALIVVADPLLTTTPPAHVDREDPADEPVDPPVVTPVLEIDENDPLADLIVHGPESPVVERPTFDDHELIPSSDLIVEESSDLIVEETDTPSETSWYPALPAPVGDGPEPMDATEAALREIRDRLATPVPAKRRRRFRRRFIVASGLSTALALGVFATSAGLGVTQLPV
jgi:hypothetical protein